MIEDMRRKNRLHVCCRATVRDRYGVWTGVTEDVSVLGCRIVTRRLLRAGSLVMITLASDLFAEEIELVGETAWATPDRLGVRFIGALASPGGITAAAWLEKVVEHGEIPNAPSTWRLAPSLVRQGATPVPRNSRSGLRIASSPLRADVGESATSSQPERRVLAPTSAAAVP